MSAGPGPLPPPPQLSPDGKYVWDGSEWRPIAGAVEVSHGAVFKAWNSIQVEPADPVVAAAAPAAVQFPAGVQVQTPVQEPEPVIDYSSHAVFEPSGPIVPLWQQQRSTGINKFLYAGAGVVVFVMGLILLNYLNFQVPWPAAPSPSAAPTVRAEPSPPPSRTRSEFGRADAFLNDSLAPALATFAQADPAIQTCSGTMSNSCFDAITVTDPTLKQVLAVIDQGHIPPCIDEPMKKFRSDLGVMEAGLQLALKGYKDQKRSEVIDGVYRFNHFGQFLTADANAIDQAWKTFCSKDLEGP